MKPAIVKPPPFTLPTKDQRTTIVGRTGSGKTQQGTWLLSKANFHEQPWVILDFKRDRLLNSIDKVRQIGLDTIPDDPGLYIVHLDPGQDDHVNRFLRDVADHEDIGLYFDECYEIPHSPEFRRILTQGRSKNIPAICLSQRPAWVPRFVFSEADHYSIFHLNHRLDQKKIGEFVPDDKVGDLRDRLPEFHSRWYNVRTDTGYQLGPVPDAKALIDEIEKRLKRLEPEANRQWF